jgi:hypothetical protein
VRACVLPTLLALSVTPLLACTSDGSGDSTDETNGDGDGSGCYIRATLEQTDGMIVDYDVAAISDQTDPARHFIETDVLAKSFPVHVLRLSWPAGITPGTYPFPADNEVIFMVITDLGNGMTIGGGWEGGSASFTELGEGLAGTVAVTPRGPGEPVWVVDIRGLEFGCE